MSDFQGINEYIRSLVTSPRMAPEVVYHRRLSSAPARFSPVAEGADGIIRHTLAALGVKALYAHQVEGIERVRQHRHVVISTPTASGKTFIYNLPVIERIQADPTSRALYIFPLKALAQDQLRAFSDMAAAADLSETATAAIYDGDTTDWQRKKIRREPPAVIMTNPDMMHLSLLPYHELWAEFLRRLEVVVIDEIHTYRGVMGSHMAQVFRRLHRLCAHYGAEPVFVASSATIANPGELTGRLTGLEVGTLDNSGAPRGRRHVVLMNPAAGPVATAIALLKAALHRKLRTIVYTQSRKLTELISLWAEKSNVHADRISSYRAGFLPEERRDIEQKLASGKLLAVISTSALELGIDIGDLDLCILVGYPGSVMATWQRGGRVGRQGQDSALILVAGEDALDQYFMRNPEELLKRPPETAVINPENRNILEKHLICAAAELPLQKTEPFLVAAAAREAVARLEKSGRLLRSENGQYLHATRKFPQRSVDLRGAGQAYQLLCSATGRHIGDIDGLRVFRDAHPGAVYIHQGRTYVVESLDPGEGKALVSARKVNYYTKVRSDKDTEILEVFTERQLPGFTVSTGRIKVTEQITGYEKWLLYAKKRIHILPLDLPPLTFETEGVWFAFPRRLAEMAAIEQRHYMGGLHALEHAVIGVLPYFVMCDRNDLGGISQTWHPQINTAAVFIYDALAGGIGLSRQAGARAEEILGFTRDLIQQCPCNNGCPSCVHSPKCGSGNRPIDKSCSLFILNGMLHPEWPAVMPAPAVPVKPPQEKQAGRNHTRRRSLYYGVFDIETQRSAREVGGWHRADRMGISCVVLYDSAQNCYLTYLEDQVPAFIQALQKLELVVGFNNKRFDNRVLAGYSDFDFSSLPTLDMLEEVHKTLGYRLSLDNLAGVTLGTKKSADGLQALTWWKQGKIDEIVEYCRQDVALTRDLYRFGRQNGYLLFHNKAQQTVRLPVDW